MQRVYDERLRLNPGASELVQACKAAGLKVLLVSGGFTFFTDRIRDRLGIDFTRSNVLEIREGVLTGRMVDQAWGDICDGAEKKRMLLQTCAQLGLEPRQAIAVGDGANDLPMMSAAGLSVAYQAKPAVREQACVALNQDFKLRLFEVAMGTQRGCQGCSLCFLPGLQQLCLGLAQALQIWRGPMEGVQAQDLAIDRGHQASIAQGRL
jgi:phosphoserine phosphatase